MVMEEVVMEEVIWVRYGVVSFLELKGPRVWEVEKSDGAELKEVWVNFSFSQRRKGAENLSNYEN